MEPKLKIYLETTLFNYYFLQDPSRQNDIDTTKRLFEEIRKGNFLGFVSDTVLRELQKCPEQNLKNKMLSLVEEFNLHRIFEQEQPEFTKLAERYVLVGAIPKKKLDDALHIAIASLFNLDILASWNYAHIVRYKTRQVVHDINLIMGFPDIIISNPHEIFYEPTKPENK